MNKLNNIKRSLFALVMCLSLTLCGCGSNEQKEDAAASSAETQQSEDVSAEEVMIDYGDAESFEAALNEGKKLEGKVVRFIAGEFHPQSKLGYNVWAGDADLRNSYNVTVLQQAKKLGKQLGQLEASGFSGAAFMDKDEIKIFAQQ